MAVNESTPGGATAGAATDGSEPATAYRVDPRRTLGYRTCRAVFQALVGTWFRPSIAGREHIPAEGAVILAPVHRSFADFGFNAFLTDRKLFFMAKDELWQNPLLGRMLDGLGAFPVHRAAADREALRRAEAVLHQGQALVLFPEGTRKVGPEVAPLLEGAAFLAARTGAPIVPIGIAGSDLSMPKGRLVPKPLRIRVVVGDPIPSPPRSGAGRVPRSAVHAATEALRAAIQKVYDEAQATRP